MCGGEGGATSLEELGRQELLCAEGHLVLHEVVVVIVAVVDVRCDGEVGELGKEVGAVRLLGSRAVGGDGGGGVGGGVGCAARGW